MNNELLKDAESLTKDYMKTYTELIHETVEGLTYGTTELRDNVKFLSWYTMMATKPEPDGSPSRWVEAISYFPEGRRWINRYLKLQGIERDQNE